MGDPTQADRLSGPQKAAVLLVQLGRERTAQVLRTMDETEVEQIMAEVARLDEVHTSVMHEVMAEFVSAVSVRASHPQGGMSFVRDVLQEGLGPDRAKRMLRRLDGDVRPFDFLKDVDDRQVLLFLADEHPQTVALVLAHLEPEQAAPLLAGLRPDVAAEVAGRIAAMLPPLPEVVRQVEAVLEEKLAALTGTGRSGGAGGIQPLVDILNRSTPEVEAAVLAELAVTNPELADEVRRKLFVFEDIVKLDDRAVQLLLREVDSRELATAMKGVSDDVRAKIMGNLSERAAANLAEETDLLGPVRMPVVEEARDSVVAVIRTLESSGQIVLSRGGETFVS